jgi:hypothetical protein
LDVVAVFFVFCHDSSFVVVWISILLS